VEFDLAGLALRSQCRVDVTHQGIAAGPPPGGSGTPLLHRNVSKDGGDASV
jgi:hypothetical protein